MNVLDSFLRSEINTQELYDEIIEFITSFHIRMGEFEGNDYIIKKMDQINFIIFPEYLYEDGHREIHAAVAIYRENFINRINDYALTKEIVISNKK